jgi:hypothetical protein
MLCKRKQQQNKPLNPRGAKLLLQHAAGSCTADFAAVLHNLHGYWSSTTTSTGTSTGSTATASNNDAVQQL